MSAYDLPPSFLLIYLPFSEYSVLFLLSVFLVVFWLFLDAIFSHCGRPFNKHDLAFYPRYRFIHLTITNIVR